MQERRHELPDGSSVVVRITDRTDGDFGLTAPGVAGRRSAAVDGHAVFWPKQVHGTSVTDVVSADDAARLSGSEGDAAVCTVPDVAVSVITADCVPLAVWSDNGVVGVAHAGWRGLLGGVIEETIERVRSHAGPNVAIHALLGPCILPECYEFGADDLALLAARYGDAVQARDAHGRPALDVPATVAAAVSRSGASLDRALAACTACDPQRFSWRARQDQGRQMMAVWRTLHAQSHRRMSP